MRGAITVCLVPEARRGPFVFHDGLEQGCREAAEHGFDEWASTHYRDDE